MNNNQHVVISASVSAVINQDASVKSDTGSIAPDRQNHQIAEAGFLLSGHVMHCRYRPVRHRFVYPVFCVRIGLSHLAHSAHLALPANSKQSAVESSLNSFWFGINCRRLLSIYSRDYGPRDGSDLYQWLRTILQQYGIPADGECYLQTFPRVLGFAFNPVSFFYCHDASGGLRAVLAEVNNTFGETHRYLLAAEDLSVITSRTVLRSRKLMHVSPFCEVQGDYVFRFRDTTDTASVAIDYHDAQGLLIKTAIAGKRLPLNTANLRRAVLAQPFLTFAVVVRIHWQAFRLWRKGVSFYAKPAAPDKDLSFREES